MSKVEEQCAQLNRALGERYEVIHHIRGGGMAEVFLARNVNHGALFAVKVLAAHLSQNDHIVARFQIEAELAAKLYGHANIVPVFDIGAFNGLHYLVMPYIEGEDMASFVLRHGRLQPNDAANIVAQVAEALSWAEAKGVVHRDLKPANIRLDTSGRAIVVDFGIAKASDGSIDLTLPGEGLGTPYYMCPEQFVGDGCDARSDLYSLGVVFFELLTGERPFKGATFAEIKKAHLTMPVPDLRFYDPELPPTYDQVVYRLLEKDPANRFQTAKELLAELSRLGVSSGHSPLMPAVDKIASPWARRIPFATEPALVTGPRSRPYAVAALSLVSVTLIVAVVAALMLSRPRSTVADSAGTMMLVPGGNFIFGDDAAISPHRPRQTISLPSFYVDETEVSNAKYKRFCDATGHAPPNSPTFLSQPDYPVAGVTFEDAEAYAAWAAKRLPTEQEWEKAARGRDGRPYPWGWTAWTDGVPQDLQPADSFRTRQSPVGALNMAGNVYEWTDSVFPAGESDYAALEPRVGKDMSEQWYSIKGGAFLPKIDTRHFLSFTRGGFPKNKSAAYIGFRCVRDVPKDLLWDRLRSNFAK